MAPKKEIQSKHYLKRNVAFRLSELYHKKLEIMAEEKDVTISKYVESVLIKHLEETDEKLVMGAILSMHTRLGDIEKDFSVFSILFDTFIEHYIRSTPDVQSLKNEAVNKAVNARLTAFYNEALNAVSNGEPRLKYALTMREHEKDKV